MQISRRKAGFLRAEQARGAKAAAMQAVIVDERCASRESNGL